MKKSERLGKSRTAGQAAGRKIAKINHAAGRRQRQGQSGPEHRCAHECTPPFLLILGRNTDKNSVLQACSGIGADPLQCKAPATQIDASKVAARAGASGLL